MASVLVTGSADGIGRETAATLAAADHRVVLHARSEERAAQARAAVPDAAAVVVGDLASLAETKALAGAADSAGPFDAVIHNAGVWGRGRARSTTVDGLEQIFQVNVLAPFILTALMARPGRLVYLSSGLEAQGRVDFADLQHERPPWDDMQAYCDSKMFDVVLAFAVARLWPGVISNAVNPGWIKTRMGGSGASDELPAGANTPAWLATSDDRAAIVSGRYLYRREELRANPSAYDVAVQERLLESCASLSGVELPR
jgi:NAD(P)-dependent dehydrogenase (short-subunit alcohol dehydrogenase family)